MMIFYGQREEMPGAAEKINKIGGLLKYIMLIPKFKKAWIKAWDNVYLYKIAMDLNDKYHTSFWRGYNYGGKSFDERYQFFLDTHKDDFPPYNKRINPEDTANFLLGE
jgi:hypothetical protein